MASTGHGTSVHLSGELFKAMTKSRDGARALTGGAASAYPDFMAGNVHVISAT